MQFLKDMGTWRHDIFHPVNLWSLWYAVFVFLYWKKKTSTLKASSILPSRGSQCNFILKLEVPSETNLGDDLSRALGASIVREWTKENIQMIVFNQKKIDVERKGNVFFWGTFKRKWVVCTRELLLMEEIRRSPVEVGSLSHFLEDFIHPRWFSRQISEPSTVLSFHFPARHFCSMINLRVGFTGNNLVGTTKFNMC